MIKSRITELRKAKGLTLQQLADLCETTHATISRLECGKQSVTLDWLETIANALEVDPAAIIASKGDISVSVTPSAVKIDATLRTTKDADWLIARITDLKATLMTDAPAESKVVALVRK